MNTKMTTNSQLSTTKPKNQNQNQTKQTIRTGTESQKWRSHCLLYTSDAADDSIRV